MSNIEPYKQNALASNRGIRSLLTRNVASGLANSFSHLPRYQRGPTLIRDGCQSSFGLPLPYKARHLGGFLYLLLSNDGAVLVDFQKDAILWEFDQPCVSIDATQDGRIVALLVESSILLVSLADGKVRAIESLDRFDEIAISAKGNSIVCSHADSGRVMVLSNEGSVGSTCYAIPHKHILLGPSETDLVVQEVDESITLRSVEQPVEILAHFLSYVHPFWMMSATSFPELGLLAVGSCKTRSGTLHFFDTTKRGEAGRVSVTRLNGVGFNEISGAIEVADGNQILSYEPKTFRQAIGIPPRPCSLKPHISFPSDLGACPGNILS